MGGSVKVNRWAVFVCCQLHTGLYILSVHMMQTPSSNFSPRALQNSPPVMQSSSPEVSRSGGGGGDWNEWEGPAGAWSQGDTWQGGTTTSETVPLPHNLQPSLDHAPNPGGSPATMPSRGMRLSGRTSAEKSKSPTNSERRGNQREEGAGRTDPQSTVAGGTRLDGESGASGSLDRKATSPSSDDSSAKSPKKGQTGCRTEVT